MPHGPGLRRAQQQFGADPPRATDPGLGEKERTLSAPTESGKTGTLLAAPPASGFQHRPLVRALRAHARLQHQEARTGPRARARAEREQEREMFPLLFSAPGLLFI